MDIQHLINDALMTIFFFLVGLEINRELNTGHLAGFKKAIVPLLAALGGMLVPALIYLVVTDFKDLRGWAVPVATDIALAVGVLSYFGAKKSGFLRPFLLGLAVIDDIGAILIIALLFSKGITFQWAIISILIVLIVVWFKKININTTYVYVVLGVLLWYGLYETGIHPTIAGVILGLLAPVSPIIEKKYIDIEELKNVSTVENAIKTKRIAKNSVSVVEWLEHVIHPWSAFLVVPIFAFANSGIKIDSKTFELMFQSKVALGIILGLVIGKPVGILLLTYFTKFSKIGQIPKDVKWHQLLGVGNAAGIGFTVAIFIAKLAFKDQEIQDLAILSVLVASVTSALIAVVALKISDKNS
jgi:NhaA family Na+:H+ antiporter